MPKLGDRWRLLAPDFPGCGYALALVTALCATTGLAVWALVARR
jgi:hypothetical protein